MPFIHVSTEHRCQLGHLRLHSLQCLALSSLFITKSLLIDVRLLQLLTLLKKLIVLSLDSRSGPLLRLLRLILSVGLNFCL